MSNIDYGYLSDERFVWARNDDLDKEIFLGDAQIDVEAYKVIKSLAIELGWEKVETQVTD